MDVWSRIPPILKRKFLLTLLAGLGAAAVSLVVFLASGDRMILALGGVLLLCCILRGRAVWLLISRECYETAEGVCVDVTSPPFRRYRKIHLLDGNGDEFTVLLDRNARLHIGAPYRFYFRKDAGQPCGNAYLDASLSTSSFLGYEELQPEYEDAPEPTEK